MREGTTSREMAVNRPYGEFYDFYSISPEYFGYHHIVGDVNMRNSESGNSMNMKTVTG
jgi:hypothetical protein